MIRYAHGAVLTSSILPDCLTLSPFKSFPTAFQAHFPYKHHQTVDNIREICEEPLSLLLWYQNWQFNPHQLTMRLKKAAMLWLLSSRSQCCDENCVMLHAQMRWNMRFDLPTS